MGHEGVRRVRKGRRGGAGARAVLALSLLALPRPLWGSPSEDYAFLLARSVKEDGVDYGELAAGRAALDAYVRSLAEADPGALDADRIAFWLNAWNALVLQGVLDERPRDAKGLLEGRSWRVAGREVTLAGIEETLRALRQPLVRFGLYRASRSGPPLSAVPYRGSDVEEALALQARAYLGDPARNHFEYAQLRAELSMLLHWHREEFEAGRKGDVPPLQLFLADFVPGEERFEAIARSLRKTEWRISFRPWDWSLDEVRARKPGVHPAWVVVYALAAAALLFLGFRAFRTLFTGTG